ncbi:MAG: hypothetical protein G01um10143_517 [Parcubacteria group bacterium Gr01-1014_3]|nr:MAG: hypothetical protein G01um10143_517 [Parcubacteria group bacterium Gr01-1014_3]
MTKLEFPKEFENDETLEEYVRSRVEDINEKKGFLYAQTYPDFPAIQRNKNIVAINRLCDKIEGVLPEVRGLIKVIFPHIKSITAATKVAAAYLLISRAYSNLQTSLLVCRNGKNLEAMELSRSGKEALDLAMLFWEDNNKSSLDKWFKGEIIGNAHSRKFQHEYFNNGLAGVFQNEDKPIKAILGKGYKIMSNYTHSGYAGLLDSIDVFKLDFDFESQSGYHYCVDNFHIVEDLLIKILLNLKNSFLHLKDHDALPRVNRILKTFNFGLTPEQMNKVFNKHKKGLDNKSAFEPVAET